MPDPFLNGSSAFDEDWSQTIGGKTYRGKEPGGPHPRNDDFSFAGKTRNKPCRLDIYGKYVGIKAESVPTTLFVPDGDLYCIDIAYGGFLPGIKPLSNDPPVGDFISFEKQAKTQILKKLILTDGEINGKVAYLKRHVAPLPIRREIIFPFQKLFYDYNDIKRFR